ncbi:MAG: rhodanese-like domain-containing protein [Candidatus Binataceae bacterium]
MPRIGEIEPRELKHRIERGDDILILDVRELEEIAIARLRGAVNLPMGEVPSRITELDPNREIVVLCHHGIRSAQVAAYLASMGFERVSNLSGGIDEWSATVDPATPRY